MTWPLDTREELDAFYGKHSLSPTGVPTFVWEMQNLVTIDLPYPMRLAWDPSVVVRRARCHNKVAQSLLRVLQAILKVYGSPEAIRAAGVDLFGGCFQYRRISGSKNLSLHAWGAAIDLDPDHNGLGDASGDMPALVVKCFEDEGWVWGGRFKKRPDPMHFQAARES